MKPPPRTRSKTNRCKTPEPEVPRACKGTSKASNKSAVWSQSEKKRLSNALRRLNRTNKRDEELDYDSLAKSVSTRSPTEVQSVVESLKNKIINCGSFMIRKWKLEEENSRKPIQVWADLASAVAGTREEVISSAFSQMMVIASTEPCTLRNCDPPYLHALHPNKVSTAGHVSIKRPLLHLPAQVKSEAASSCSPISTPKNTIKNKQKQNLPNMAGTSAGATATSQSSVTVKPPHPASKVAMVTPRSDSGSETQSGSETDTHSIQQSLGTPPTTAPTTSTTTTTSTSKSTSSAPLATPSHSGASPCPSASMPVVGEPGHSQRGWLGVKYVVDFEKIYRYLGTIHKPNEQCSLTPMESAIVLDLLMSLPEEIRQLDCHELNKHLTQVYKHLSSPCSKDPKDRNKLTDQQKPDRKDGDVTDGGGEEINQSSSSDNNASSQSHGTDVICPPLNPFMIPLTLLKRKKAEGSPVK